AGKDSVASVIAAYMAASFKPNGLRPGERAVVCCLAVNREQAQIVFNYTRAYFEMIPALAGMVTSMGADTIGLNNGVDIIVSTSNFRVARGRSIVCAIFDEVCFWRDEDSSVNPDKEIHRGIRPGLSTIPGSILIAISSVYKRSGLAFERFSRSYGKN